MFTPTNKLVDLLPYFKRKLVDLYDDREIENIFAWVCHHRFNLNRNEIKSEGIRLSESELLDFRSVVKRLEKHEPIQYILGEVEFYNCTIKVNQNTLIPRPETEELVDLILKENRGEGILLDIGTGSGCIPIALKKANPAYAVYALDISPEALEIARKSAELNKVEVQFMKKDILVDALEDLPQFDLIVSNPPYVLESDKAAMSPNVLEFEPHLALFVADTDPLLFYRRIAQVAASKLKAGGKLYVEIHENFGLQTVDLLNDHGYQNILIIKDMQGKDRMVSATK